MQKICPRPSGCKITRHVVYYSFIGKLPKLCVIFNEAVVRNLMAPSGSVPCNEAVIGVCLATSVPESMHMLVHTVKPSEPSGTAPRANLIRSCEACQRLATLYIRNCPTQRFWGSLKCSAVQPGGFCMLQDRECCTSAPKYCRLAFVTSPKNWWLSHNIPVASDYREPAI